MTKEEFTREILESEKMLNRISMSMLKNETDCQDAVQNAVLIAYKKLDTLKNEQYFKTWLVRILINECNHILKLRGRVTTVDEKYAEMYNQDNALTNERLEIQNALEMLSPKIRIVIVMFYIEDFTIEEIHRALKIPIGTVKSRLSAGIKKLKLELD